MGVIKHSLTFSLATFLSRIFGYVRDAIIAYYFGASQITDAFFIAFRLPNTFRRLLGEGGFNAAFIPIYARRKDKEFLSSAFTYYALANILITLLGILLSEHIITLIAPGIRGRPYFELAVFMSRWLFTYTLFVGLSSFFMAVLNTRGVFFIPAFAQAVFNIFFSFLVILFAKHFGYYSLIVGVLLGGVAQLLFNLPSFLKLGTGLRISLKIDEDMILLVKRLFPALLGFGVAQLSFFIDTFLASFLTTGSVSYLYYANRLFQLPLGAVSVGVANSLLSVISGGGNAKDNTLLAFRFILLVSIPASFGLLVMSDYIVAFLYGRGRFKGEDILVSSVVLRAYALGLVFFSLQKVISSIFFAKGDTKTPVKASFVSILSEGISACFYTFFLGWGAVGLSLGTSTSSFIGFSYLFLRARGNGVHIKDVLSILPKPLVASLIMVVTVLFMKHFLARPEYTLIIVPVAMVVYFIALMFLKESLSLLAFSRFNGLVKKKTGP
ncbi:MAG: murein biosynthesis integral membrane protein MurJ [Aquificaceae bacterium]